MRGAAGSTSRLWIDDAPHFLIVFATPLAAADYEDDDNADDDDGSSSNIHASGTGADDRRRRRAAFHAHIGELTCNNTVFRHYRRHQHAHNDKTTPMHLMPDPKPLCSHAAELSGLLLHIKSSGGRVGLYHVTSRPPPSYAPPYH
jgi:hypothetical protein